LLRPCATTWAIMRQHEPLIADCAQEYRLLADQPPVLVQPVWRPMIALELLAGAARACAIAARDRPRVD
jgi:hypothetical protein